MKILINKKGQGLTSGGAMWHWIFVGFLVIICGFTVLFLVDNYIQSFNQYHESIPEKIYAYRAINTCLAYQDDTTKRFYPGIIDINKFTEETLSNCYQDSYRSFSFLLRNKATDSYYDKIIMGSQPSLDMSRYFVMIRTTEGKLQYGELFVGVSKK